MTLEKLKETGAISDLLEVVAVQSKDVITISAFEQLSEAEQAVNQKVVVVDNCRWIATTKRRPAKEANTVYSCDGESSFGCWKKGKGYSFMRLINNRLAVVKKLSIKKMEDEKMNMGEATEKMSQFNMDSVESMEVPADGAGEKKKVSENVAMVTDIKKRVAGQTIADNRLAQIANKKKGRLQFFLTRTDSSVRLSKKKVYAGGKPTLKAGASDDDKAKFNAKPEKPPISLCETEDDLVFKSSKPGTIVGVALKIPAGSEISLARLKTSGAEITPTNDDTMVHRILPKEEAISYIAANFDGVIKEDAEVVGPTASTIYLDFRPKMETNKKTGAKEQKIVVSFKLQKDDKKRNSLLTESNYFPIKMYQTIPVRGASSEDQARMNSLIEAICKDEAAYEHLCAEAKAKVTRNADGTYTSDWFNKGGVPNVVKYDSLDEGDYITDIAVPVREKKVTEKKSKDGGESKSVVSYPFKYVEYGEVGGPQEKYAKLIKAANVSPEEFGAIISGITKSNKSGGSKTPKLDAKDFLRAQTAGMAIKGFNKSFTALAESIENAM